MEEFMASQAQSDAHKRNATRPSRPRDPKTKATTRFNGVKHGLRTERTILPGEFEVFTQRFGAWSATDPDLRPQDQFLMRTAVLASLRYDRVASAAATAITKRCQGILDRHRAQKQ